MFYILSEFQIMVKSFMRKVTLHDKKWVHHQSNYAQKDILRDYSMVSRVFEKPQFVIWLWSFFFLRSPLKFLLIFHCFAVFFCFAAVLNLKYLEQVTISWQWHWWISGTLCHLDAWILNILVVGFSYVFFYFFG